MNDLTIAILSIVAVANIILGLVIFSRGLKSLADILFGLIALSTTIWSIAIIGFYMEQYHLLINWIIVTHSMAILIPFFFLSFSLNFPGKLARSNEIISIAFIPLVYFEYLIFFGNTVIGVTQGNTYQIGIGYIYFSLTLVIFFFLGFFFSLLQIRKANNQIEKRQAQYVLVGSLLASTLALIPDLILPYFQIFGYTWLGPIFTLIMVVSLFLAMLKYSLFNIKVILTESCPARLEAVRREKALKSGQGRAWIKENLGV